MRKPIAIAATVFMQPGDFPIETVTAACDDGSIWRLHNGDSEWVKLPEIPQHDVPPTEPTG